ncbi:hypothetical protein V5F49_12300 [Xanthobacter sp. V3C-3]|uniref:restriction endonuclease subunit S n=1 Tax=Xanthobacter lutulentifluminis TaxID=3119935 RepID=UPI0037297655
MSRKPYPSNKDSGIEWLGHAPAHWPLTRLRFVARLNPSRSELAGLDRNLEVSFLPMEAIGEDGTLSLERTRPIGEVETGYSYMREGDVVLAKITPCFENGKGAIASSLHNGIAFGTTELIVARPRPDVCLGRFLHWLFVSPAFRKLGEASMYGAGGQKRVPDDFVRDFRVAFPPLPEQLAIAAFLDRETAKIDALVTEQERLIALLAEKRRAVISHAVTKGLDPNAPMKDSGIEWLGEVPAHWEVKRLKHLFASFEQGWSPQCEAYPAQGEDELGILKVGCVNGGTFDPSENKRLPLELEPVANFRLQRGDLLISRANTRDLVGGSAWVERDHPNLFICDKLYRARMISGEAVPSFVSMYLGSGAVRNQIELVATGASSSMLNIGQSVILDMPMARPPVEEQAAIALHVSRATAKLGTLTTEAERAIALLRERRAALISAAVTGKIDVRDAGETEEVAA